MSTPTPYDLLSTTTKLYREISLHDQVGRDCFFDPSPERNITVLTRQDRGNLRSVAPPSQICHRARTAMTIAPLPGTTPSVSRCAVDFERNSSRKWQTASPVTDVFYNRDIPFCVRPLHKFQTAQRFTPCIKEVTPVEELDPKVVSQRRKEQREREATHWRVPMVPFGATPGRSLALTLRSQSQASSRPSEVPSRSQSRWDTSTAGALQEMRIEKQEQLRKAAAFAKLGYRQVTSTDKEEKEKRRKIRGLDFGATTSRKAKMWHFIHKEDLTAGHNYFIKQEEVGKIISISNHGVEKHNLRPGLRHVVETTDLKAIIPAGCHTRKHAHQLDHHLTTGRSESIRDLVNDVKSQLDTKAKTANETSV